MRGWAEMELDYFAIRSALGVSEKSTYRKRSFSEHHHVHVDGVQVGRAIRILVETPETDEIIVAEQFDLLPRLFHLDIFSGQGMNSKNLKIRQLITRL
jgi:hypothetical protein